MTPYLTTSAYVVQGQDNTSENQLVNGSESNQFEDSVLDVVYFFKLFVFTFGSIGHCMNVAIWLTGEYRKMSRSVVYVTLSVVGGGIRKKMSFFTRPTPLRICGYVSQEEGKLFRWNRIRVQVKSW